MNIVVLERNSVGPDISVDCFYELGNVTCYRNTVTIEEVKERVKDADIIVQLVCPVLATNMAKLLVGSPSLPIPVPDTSVQIVIPEIAFFLNMERFFSGRKQIILQNLCCIKFIFSQCFRYKVRESTVADQLQN